MFNLCTSFHETLLALPSTPLPDNHQRREALRGTCKTWGERRISTRWLRADRVPAVLLHASRMYPLGSLR